MQLKVCILTASLCGASILSQDTSAQPPPAPTGTSTPTAPDQSGNSAGNFVRRFSIGATLDIVGLSLLSGGSSTVTNSTTVSTGYNASPASSRIGYGLTGQIAVADRFAVAVGGYIRKIGYTLDTTVTTTTETFPERRPHQHLSSTSTHEDTRARLYDIPVLVRFYSKGRHVPGPRWFIEGGRRSPAMPPTSELPSPRRM